MNTVASAPHIDINALFNAMRSVPYRPADFGEMDRCLDFVGWSSPPTLYSLPTADVFGSFQDFAEEPSGAG